MILSIDVSLVMGLSVTCWTLGYWMMRTKAKAWAVPVNTVLVFTSVAIAVAWGIITEGYGIGTTATYAVNGVVAWGVFTTLYDFWHEFTKRKDEWLSVWKSFCNLFKKKGAKA